MAAALPAAARPRLGRVLSSALLLRPKLLLALLLVPPLLWLGVVYLGAMLALLVQSFFSIDEFTGLIQRTLTLRTYAELLRPAHLDIILRTAAMAGAVTLASAVVAFPVGYYMARYASGRAKTIFYLAVMLPLWSSYLVRVYAWKLILAKEGIVTWTATELGLEGWLDALLSIPVIGGTALSVSYVGTFTVFVYIWLPYMILPIQAALERVPQSIIDASADLGAPPHRTFRDVILHSRSRASSRARSSPSRSRSATTSSRRSSDRHGSSWVRWSTSSRGPPETFRSPRRSAWFRSS